MIKVILLLFLLTGLFFFIGRLFAGRKGMIIALSVALLLNLLMNWHSDSILLKAYKARPVPENHRLFKITEEISHKSELPTPGIYLIPSSSALIISPEHRTVAATEGILTLLSDSELKGVIAHELGHVKNHDSYIQLMAVALSGAIAFLSLFALFFGGNKQLGWGKTLILAIISPVIASIISMGISRQKEYLTDEFAGRLTGNPVALASALQKLVPEMKKHSTGSYNPRSPHMAIGNLFSAAGDWELFSTHPRVKKRVERLNELAEELKQ